MERDDEFAAFAEECGLSKYPRPDGERYICDLDGTCKGKKIECIEFMDELWNALARSKGRDDLVIR